MHGTIITNIETDHLDYYGSFDGIVDSFDQYLAQITGPKIINADDDVTRRLGDRHGAITFGLSSDADVRAVNIEAANGSFKFDVKRRSAHGTNQLGSIHLPMRGIYNVRNALAAAAMALEIGVEFADIAAALAKFGGVARRFDVRGVDGGATFVDDYAHLPTEIDSVLTGARESGDGWNRVIAVFQPNRFNRISEIWRDYADAFGQADLVALTDIFASGTTPIPGITGKLIVNAVTEAHPASRVIWLPSRSDLVSFIAGEARSGDVVISMGCGDIASFPSEVLDARRSA